MIENIYIKSQILRQLLEEHNDKLSLSIKSELSIESAKDSHALIAVGPKLRCIIERTDINIKMFYDADIYWYMMFLAYGEDAIDEEEDMIYVDRYEFALIPGKDRQLETAKKITLYLKNRYPNFMLKFKVIKTKTGNEVERLVISYETPATSNTEECVFINSQIILDAFDQYDYQK